MKELVEKILERLEATNDIAQDDSVAEIVSTRIKMFVLTFYTVEKKYQIICVKNVWLSGCSQKWRGKHG